MSDVYSVKEKMHKMRAKLYPNYLPGYEHTFIARTSSEDAATVADICASMKNRGGYEFPFFLILSIAKKPNLSSIFIFIFYL